MNIVDYQADYFQRLKNDDNRYASKREANKAWLKTDDGRRWKREYMRKWYYDHRGEINEARKAAYNKRVSASRRKRPA
jgi:hypothetical protein